jgi:hypothetical protein
MILTSGGPLAFLRRLAVALAAIGCTLPGAAVAQIDGRWNLVLQTPGGAFPTPVEFVVQDGRRVTATMLGPTGTFRLSQATGTLNGNRLRLSARSSFGRLKVSASVAGGELRGRWSAGGLITSLVARGALRGSRQADYVRTPPLELYGRVWAQIERHFYAPDFNGVDVRALRERYRPQIEASRSDGEFLAAMRTMLGEFRVSHLDLFATPSADGVEEPPGRPGSAAETHGVTWRQVSATIGYLRIESFVDGPATVERIDRAFAELGGNDGLVIDVRENGGGTLSAAMRLGDYFFPEQRPVGYFASRHGLARRQAASIDQLNPSELPLFTGYTSAELGAAMVESGAVMLATGGRAPRPYRGRVALLVDEYCFSACEALASVAKESGAATLFGRRTAGAMLAAFPIDIEGGWTLLLPAWDFRTPGGGRVEGRGVEPDVAIRKRGRGDPELAAALRFLRSASPAVAD